MRTRLGWGGLAMSLALGVTTSVLGTTACSSSSAAAPAPTGIFTVQNYPKPQIANAVSQGDPLWEGQYYFLYDTWGGEVNGGWPVDFLLGVLKSEPAFFGNQFENFGFIPDPNDNLPIGFKRGTIDPTRASQTCAPCHAGKLADGTVWFGQANVQIDAARLNFELNKRWVAQGHTSAMSAIAQSRAPSYGPGRFGLDSDDYSQAVGADIPVQYNLAERTHTATVGSFLDARSDIFIAVASIVGYPAPGAQTSDPFPDDTIMTALVNFMTSRNPPTPPAQDASQIAAGKAVFHTAQCDSCHHPDAIDQDGVVSLDYSAGGLDRMPGVDANYPRGSVHADPSQFYMAFGNPNEASSASGQLDPQALTIIKFAYTHKLNLATSDGYMTPNLHGLWASAPYLNNGSVPTIQDLLNPAAQRPTSFQVQGFAFDTTQPGNSNMGHEFGTTLSASDKTSLIAYLNSL